MKTLSEHKTKAQIDAFLSAMAELRENTRTNKTPSLVFAGKRYISFRQNEQGREIWAVRQV